MRKLLVLFIAVLAISFSFGANTPSSSGPKPALKAKDIMIPIGNTGQKISLLDLSRMSVKDVQKVTGKKMKWVDRIGFKAAQYKLRQSINPDGTVNTKNYQKALKKVNDGTSGFHIGGFALGFLLGLIGVLIAYLINDDKKSNRVKWAWIGLAVWAVIVIIAFLA